MRRTAARFRIACRPAAAVFRMIVRTRGGGSRWGETQSGFEAEFRSVAASLKGETRFELARGREGRGEHRPAAPDPKRCHYGSELKLHRTAGLNLRSNDGTEPVLSLLSKYHWIEARILRRAIDQD